MRMRLAMCIALGLLTAGKGSAAEEAAVEKGTVRFAPLDDQAAVPERYRLGERTFAYEMSVKYRMPAVATTVYRLTYPSPVDSKHKENNTVHAEYYRPEGQGPFPAVIVLDITGGDQSLSRNLATHFAKHRIAALFVQMAYYGPRRPPGSNLRLMSPNIPHTLAAVQQTVLDLRCAAAWLEARPEVDRKRLGILGTSLGSFMAALTSEMEPRFSRTVLLLGGGGFVDGYWDHPQALPYRKAFEALGGTKQQVKDLLAPLDPLTCAANLKQRRLLMVAAKNDEIVPPRMAEALWQASGKQEILWYDCGHYSAIVHLPDALEHVVRHLKAE
jgi:dienelactone hydrolase